MVSCTFTYCEGLLFKKYNKNEVEIGKLEGV